MKNIFRIFHKDGIKKDAPAEVSELPAQREESTEEKETAAEATAEKQLSGHDGAPQGDPVKAEKAPRDDGFVTWCRSKTQGGIERRERNDIYEAYSLYGTDQEGRLSCRYYHRYPEHERDFALSYSRVLTFAEFNSRLLGELDKGGLTLGEYHDCVRRAEEAAAEAAQDIADYTGFTDEELAALRAFCEGLDNLGQKRYRYSDGVFHCEADSAVEAETLHLCFRRPLRHDALYGDTAGVSREKVGGYDIDDIWIMGVFNRLRDRCAACGVTRMISEWSLRHETVWLMTADGLDGVGGSLLVAVGEVENLVRFGFYTLGFSGR